MESLLIRKATESDSTSIALLARVTFTQTFGPAFKDRQDLLDYCDRTFSVSKINSSLRNGNNVFWIALYDQLPVGYAKLKKKSNSDFITSDRVSQLQKIYVLGEFIGKSIGQRLQDKVIDEAIELGSAYLWLSVLDSNDRAISFYKKHKYEEKGSHVFKIGTQEFDFIVMTRSLDLKEV